MNSVLFECYMCVMDLTDNEKSSFRNYNENFGVARDIFSSYWNYLSSNISNDLLVQKIYNIKINGLEEKLINNPSLFIVFQTMTNDIYKWDRDYHGKCNSFPFVVYRDLAKMDMYEDYFDCGHGVDFDDEETIKVIQTFCDGLYKYFEDYFHKYMFLKKQNILQKNQ